MDILSCSLFPELGELVVYLLHRLKGSVYFGLLFSQKDSVARVGLSSIMKNA
jgi:hypothetical protein